MDSVRDICKNAFLLDRARFPRLTRKLTPETGPIPVTRNLGDSDIIDGVATQLMSHSSEDYVA